MLPALPDLLLGLTEPTERDAARAALARRLGVEDVLLFVCDRAVGKPLPAPGFSQTLPGAAGWRAFLAGCVAEGSGHALLAVARDQPRNAVSGVADDHGDVLVLVGGSPDLEQAAQARGFLPFLGRAVQREWEALAASGHAAAARETEARATVLAASLDATRRDLADSLARAEEERGWVEFLCEASAALAISLDRDQTLANLARLVVPRLADVCLVDALEPGGVVRRIAVERRGPAREELLERLRRRPVDRHGDDPVARCLRTGASVQVDAADDASGDADTLRELGFAAYRVVPLVACGRTLGAMSLASAEAPRPELVDDLARRAALALDNARLYGELLATDRRKDAFLATLAHELRNPLAPITTALHLIPLRASDPSSLARLTGLMERQTRHMTRLIDDLLDVSRITRGRVDLRKQVLDLRLVATEAVESTRPLVDARRHALEVRLGEAPLWVDADPTRLLQIIANLVNNAAKYTDTGGHLSLTASREGGQAVVRVRDDGIGVPADMLEQIFDLFVQAHPASAIAEGGLGIGLTLVRDLVRLHGGTVEASSEGPGAGSEFVVRLPLAASPAPTLPATPPPVRQGEVLERLLVVDDNVDGATTLADLLRLVGFTVQVEHDGSGAVAAALAFGPDAVLLDIGLPGLDGLEVARRLRASGELREVRLIAVTGYGQTADIERTRRAGFDHHLVKPIELERLLALLSRSPRP